MAGLKTFPQAPYHDDFDPLKGYLGVGFVPQKAVQTREVNQMQTILKSQLSKLADHFFENGARVVRGESAVNNAQPFLKLSTSLSRVASAYVNQKIVSTNGVEATIIAVIKATGTDPDTLYIQYTKGSATISPSFAINNATITHSDSTTENVSVSATGNAASFILDKGVFYLNAQFVTVDSTFYILNKYAPLGIGTDISMGFVVTNKIVTSDDDPTLLDNASGSSNFSAPGAHRFKIEVRVTHKPTLASDLANYVEISRIVDGVLANKSAPTDYTTFQDILAQRTYDESGDYIVDDFTLDVREHLNDGANRGQFLLANGGVESKLVYVLDPGKAYVRGYPIETTYNTSLISDKARTFKSQDNVILSLPYNSYITVTTDSGFVFGKTVELKQSATVIGYGIVRDIRYAGATGTVQLDLVNIYFTVGAKSLSDVNSVNQPATSSVGVVTGYSYDATNSALVYELPFGYVQSLASASISYRAEYSVAPVIVSGVASVTVSSSAIFSSVASDYVCQYALSAGTALVAPTSVSLQSGGTVAVLTLPSAPTSNVKVVASITKGTSTYRSKVPTTVTESITLPSLTLSHTDAYEIVSIMQGSADVTAAFALDGGQRDTVYDFAKLVAKSGAPVSGSISVTYKYFAHSAGDYFAKNSYNSIDYSDIPSYTFTNGKKVFLGSVIDFRRSVTVDGNDHAIGFANSFVINSTMLCDYSTYLPRYDKIVVDKFGKFGVVQGTPKQNPEIPVDIDNAMTLYTVLVNPFTFSNSDVVITKSKNRRYTMQDIGKIENRLETVEYYTSLSLLEKQTIDQTFTNKFNTGFLVDNFKTQTVADTSTGETIISYDMVVGEIRPQTPSRFIPLSLKSGTNTVEKNGLVLLDYTEVKYMVQSLGSEVQKVQPYINYQWNGSLTMYPSEDSWFDTNYLPDEIVDAGVYSVTHNTPKNWLDSLVSANSNKPTFLKETFETTTPVAFIRNRKVSVTGVGFLPNSKLNFFFDEVNVNAYVRPVGGILGADVISNGTGNFDAEFEIPCSATLRFRCGERILKVINTTGNGEISSTSGVASYVANGLSNNYRKTYITTRHEISSTNTQGVSVLYPDPNVGSPSQPSGYVDSPSSGFYGGPGALSGIAPSPTGLDGPGAAAAGIAAGIAASAIGLDGPGVAAAVAAGAAAADGADASIGGLW